MEEKEPLIILTGPTAVGKTDLSLKLAKRVDGEIISADSMQVYRQMDIGSAKIKSRDMQGIPHHLIDIMEPEEEFNVVTFQQLAKKAIADIRERGRIPIITGGTGFYIQSVLYDIDFTENPEDTTCREKLEQAADEKGPEYLHKMLAAVDKESAEQIHANNVKRVIRALEFYMQTGKKISQHNEQERKRQAAYNACYFVLDDKREAIYDRIDKRVDKMLQEGLVEEVKRLRERGCRRDMVSMQGIGYRQVFEYLEGNMSLEDTIEQIKKDTRHFAKRQLTWFGREKEVVMVDKSKFGSEDEILTYMLTILKEKGIYDGSVKELL